MLKISLSKNNFNTKETPTTFLRAISSYNKRLKVHHIQRPKGGAIHV